MDRAQGDYEKFLTQSTLWKHLERGVQLESQKLCGGKVARKC